MWIACGKGIYCTLLGGMYVGLAHVILHIYDLKVVTVWLPDLFRPSGFFVLDQKPPYLSEYHEISKFEISPPTDSPSTLSFSLGPMLWESVGGEISNFDISWYSDRYGGF